MIFEVPMSDRSKANSTDYRPEDLWQENYIDLDARTLIDMQVAITDPSTRKIRGKTFSLMDRTKIKAILKKISEQHLVPFMK